MQQLGDILGLALPGEFGVFRCGLGKLAKDARCAFLGEQELTEGQF
jgi:hypothetical protein